MSARDLRVPPTLFAGSKSRSSPRRWQGQAPGIPTSNPGAPAWRLLSPAASTGMSHLASPDLGLTGDKRGRISHQDGVKIMLAIGTDHTELLRTLELSELFLKVEMGQPPMNHRFPLLGDPHVSASLKTVRTWAFHFCLWECISWSLLVISAIRTPCKAERGPCQLTVTLWLELVHPKE